MNSNAQSIDDERLLPPLPKFVQPALGRVADQMDAELRQMVEAHRPEPLSIVDPVEADPLAAIARLISEPPMTPPVGRLASQGMREAFERVAKEILAVAQDGVVRANQNLQEAMSYAEVVRKSGDLLCDKIEGDSVRLLQQSRVMREARAAFGGVPPAGPGE